MSEEICYLSIAEMGALIRRRELAPTELTKAHLERVRELDSRLLSFITLLEEDALAAAERAQQELWRGNDRGSLHGIPLGLKDLFYTKGILTTAGSRILRDFVPEYDATAVVKLREAGAIILGKLNMHEFGFGGIPGNPHWGTVRNPWDLERFAGSSSGGSGAAVLAGLVAGALGTDTGGSVRTPGTVCGIVGLKPTNGLVSTYGVVPCSRTFDTVGPMTRTVEDNALILGAIAGYEVQEDASVRQQTTEFRQSIDAGVKGVRLGIVRNFYFDKVSSDVRRALYDAMHTLEECGAKVTEITLPIVEECRSILSAIMLKEAAEFHHEWLVSNRVAEYGPYVLEQLQRGMTITDDEYVNAQESRGRVIADFNVALSEVDILVAPTYPTVAYRIDDDAAEIDGEMVPLSWITGRMTRAANVAGIPALTLPMGFSSGLPMGLQLMGRPFEEDLVYRVAYTYEQAAGWHRHHPSL